LSGRDVFQRHFNHWIVDLQEPIVHVLFGRSCAHDGRHFECVVEGGRISCAEFVSAEEILYFQNNNIIKKIFDSMNS
jgi:hypothetical protein